MSSPARGFVGLALLAALSACGDGTRVISRTDSRPDARSGEDGESGSPERLGDAESGSGGGARPEEGLDADAAGGGSRPAGNRGGEDGSPSPASGGAEGSPGLDLGGSDPALDPAGSGGGGDPPPAFPDAPRPNASRGEMAAWVWDDAALRTYQLTLPAAAWEELQRTARDEVYAPADLTVEDQVLPQVGLRFKGSLGTLDSCFDDADELICDKLSMKIKVSEFDTEQRLLGLKRLTFNSMTWDPSLLRERLAYRLYREMGVIAPRAVNARLVVNGELLGVFSLVEAVDGRFTDDRFSEGDGNLYKELWPETNDPVVLSEHLKTNEDTPDHAGMQQWVSELAASSRAGLPGVAEAHLDVGSFYAYLAVDDTIRNWDGLSAFYCYGEGGTGCENHNYYVYQHEGQSRFTIVPWDLDNTFDPVTPLDSVPTTMEVPEDCDERYPAFDKTMLAPACDAVLGGFALGDRALYRQKLQQLLDGPFAAGTPEAWLDVWQAQLEPVVAATANGPGLEEFRSAVDDLRDNLSALRARARARLQAP
jgi:hypothetical protein